MSIHSHLPRVSSRITSLLLATFGYLALPMALSAQDFKDVPYASVAGKSLALDLHLPTRQTNAVVSEPSLIVWIHGGAWHRYDKKQYPRALVDQGFAVASVDFRQSTEARFPAQAHDINAAIRFLRANATRFGVRGDRIALAGASSGGHLAALVGLTQGNATLAGTLGDHLDTSSAVQAIISYFGASNLTTILAQSTPFGLEVRRPALAKLLGAQPDVAVELARLASPVFHVDRSDPPLLLLHGDQDPQMPINQSHELEGAYEALKLPVQLYVVHGAAHAGSVFYEGEALEAALAFLNRTL